MATENEEQSVYSEDEVETIYKGKEILPFFFTKERQNDPNGAEVWTCKENSCKKSFTKCKVFNLKRHLQKQHKLKFDRFCVLQGKVVKERKNGSQLKRVSFLMSQEEFKNLVVNICTVNGRPFELFEDPSIQKLLNPIAKCLKCEVINAENMKVEVKLKAAALREELKKEIKDRYVCATLDVATRGCTSFLGVNVQYTLEGKLMVRCLKTMAITMSTKAENLRDMVLETLKVFDLDIRRVFSFTMDKGGNLLECTRQLNQISMKANTASTSASILTPPLSPLDCDSFPDDNAPTVEDGSSEAQPQVGNAAFAGNEGEETDEFGAINDSELDELLQQLEETMTRKGVNTIRCGAHSLQLAILDALSSPQARAVIGRVKLAVRELRSVTIAKLLKELNQKSAIMSNDTRWDSEFLMLQRIQELRPVIDNSILEVAKIFSPDDWDYIAALVLALEHCRFTLLAIQQEKMPYSEVFVEWTLLISHIQALAESEPLFAADLLTSLRKSSKLVFTDDLYAAVILDKRYKSLLTGNQVLLGSQRLQVIWEEMRNVHEATQPDPHPITAAAAMAGAGVSNDDSLKEKNKRVLQAIMRKHEETEACFRNSEDSFLATRSIVALVDQCLKEPNLSSDENILRYWYFQNFDHPELALLAGVLLAVPGTQASVERLFSNLQFILSEYRMNLNCQLVDDMLFLRMNCRLG